MPDCALPDHRSDGHFKRGKLNGFAIVSTKGDKGFTGVYKDDKPLVGYKKLGPNRNERKGPFNDEDHKQQRARMQEEIATVIKTCKQKETEAKKNFDWLVGYRRNRNPTIEGAFYINRDRVPLPHPFSKQALKEAVGDQDMTSLNLWYIDGDNEAINELLDVINDKLDESTLRKIWFTGWKGTMTEIKGEVLTLFASKAKNIELLRISDMEEAS